MTTQSQARVKHLLKLITNKRARIVIRHILKHGFVTTEQLEKRYGYSHPPRAARDVRETGIPLETFRVKASDGRSIAAYRLGDAKKIRKGQLQGRQAFPKKFKDELYTVQRGRCSICSGEFEARYLQVDHRVPYLVVGNVKETGWKKEDYALSCGSCNRAKSWSCEHCVNGTKDKLARVCVTCYWASPEDYVHIALREVRRADILWNESEVQDYERLKQAAQENQFPIPDFVKKIVSKHLTNNSCASNSPFSPITPALPKAAN